MSKNNEEIYLSKADLHVHTDASFDGLSSAHDVVRRANEAGISVLAVTDHDTIEGALAAEEHAAKYKDLDLIVGEEINTGEGEILGLFLKKNIKPGLGILESIDEVRNQDGIIIVPHPFFWFTLKQTITVRKFKRIYDKVDAIEVLNSSAAGRRAKYKRYRVNKEIFRLPEIGSSDAHHADYVGTAYTLFPGTDASHLKQAVRNNMTIPEGTHVTRTDDIFLAKEILKRHGKKIRNYLIQ